jgi:hypothetical protein
MSLLAVSALVGFVGLHIAAIVCACGTRIASGSRVESLFQSLFYITMTAVGLAMIYCHQRELGLGIPSGATLVAMVLLAVIDCRRTQEPVHRATATSPS